MHKLAACLMMAFGLCGAPGIAHAGVAEARDVARQNNCTPQKIEVVSQSVGLEAQTLYKVGCVAPKTDGDQGPRIDAVLVSCTGGLCSFLRGLASTGG